jgi:hypothetical protein
MSMTTRAATIRAGRLAALLALLFCCGCGAPAVLMRILGFRGEYVMVSSDVLARPGEEARIEVRLREAEIDWRPRPMGVYVLRDGQVVACGVTDHNGEFRMPLGRLDVGDTLYTVECYAPQADGNWPLRTESLVACREANAPLLVVDIDDTLTAARRRRETLFGEPRAADESVRALCRLRRQFSVLYLTRRWDFLSRRTRDWLDCKGYPAGPVIASRGARFLEDNEKNKTRALAELRERFDGEGWGVGNLASDARAYASAGLRPILILAVSDASRKKEIQQALKELREAPPSCQVVANWRQVERAILEGVSYPPSAAEARLREYLLAAERRK